MGWYLIIFDVSVFPSLFDIIYNIAFLFFSVVSSPLLLNKTFSGSIVHLKSNKQYNYVLFQILLLQ